ncbi:MAG: hypothetical protein HZA58_05540 [Acidimicrobiia bacterium]|nr:hypothetical protein [Acidimicrobiia bacterium]
MVTRSRTGTTTLAFHASRIVTDIGVLLVLASMSLTFVSAPSGNRSAMTLDALPALLLVAPIFVVTLIPDHTRPLPRPLAWGSLVLGLAAFPYTVVKYLDAVVLADTLGGSLGLGIRLLVFGSFVTVVGVAIGLARSWMGLPSGGSPTRIAATSTSARPAPRPGAAPPGRAVAGSPTRPAAPEPARPRPARAPAEQSPFADPLFDSLEIPETRVEPAPLRQPGLVFDADGAADRYVDDDDFDDDPPPIRPGSR